MVNPVGARTTEGRKVQKGQLMKDPTCYFEELWLYSEG